MKRKFDPNFVCIYFGLCRPRRRWKRTRQIWCFCETKSPPRRCVHAPCIHEWVLRPTERHCRLTSHESSTTMWCRFVDLSCTLVCVIVSSWWCVSAMQRRKKKEEEAKEAEAAAEVVTKTWFALSAWTCEGGKSYGLTYVMRISETIVLSNCEHTSVWRHGNSKIITLLVHEMEASNDVQRHRETDCDFLIHFMLANVSPCIYVSISFIVSSEIPTYRQFIKHNSR